MKWFKLKSLYCSVPLNDESFDRLTLNINNSGKIVKLNIGKLSYDQTKNFKTEKLFPLEDQTDLSLWHKPILGTKKLLGEYKAKINKDKEPEGILHFNNKGDYTIQYKIIFSNKKKYFKLVQIDCNQTVSSLNQDKVYFIFNKKKYKSKFIMKKGKKYSMTKYPAIGFNKQLDIELYSSELLRSDQLIGKKRLRFSFKSIGEKEIVFDRDTCLYHLKIDVMELNSLYD